MNGGLCLAVGFRSNSQDPSMAKIICRSDWCICTHAQQNVPSFVHISSLSYELNFQISKRFKLLLWRYLQNDQRWMITNDYGFPDVS